jgi:riboflavin-specific deaminase-like protein
VSERFVRLLPDREDGLTASEVAAEVPRAPRGDRPFVALNMISTADGRATIQGHTQLMANRADYELFHALRARADAVMVGAGTVRAESYGRMVPHAEARAAREAAGLPADPLAIVVSRSLDLSPDLGMLRAPENTVVFVTPAPEGAAEPPAAAATVRCVREPDLVQALRRLHAEYGVDCIVCEGGPHLNATLLPAGLVDELHLVLAPKLAGGPDPLTILAGPTLDPPIDLDLLSLHESGGYLFARYAVIAPAGGPAPGTPR